jgi:hypothetical protein
MSSEQLKTEFNLVYNFVMTKQNEWEGYERTRVKKEQVIIRETIVNEFVVYAFDIKRMLCCVLEASIILFSLFHRILCTLSWNKKILLTLTL